MESQPPAPGGNANNPDNMDDTVTAAQPVMLLDGKYRVERVIGEGAFGRVYLAQDTRLRRAVAVKELLATRNSTDPDLYQRYLDRFQREARAGGAITHPNVVTVYEMGIDSDQNTYLVMEYVDGTNLRDLLSQVGTLPTERIVAIALDIARGLEAVHEADIVHRDLKPANIMISRRGGAKVGDFGIAQVGTESQRTQVANGHPGTPLYMSPEQATGFGYIDGRSDLYSLGLIMYEMLVGEPYARRRVPLAQVKPNTPPGLLAIVDRLIQKEPELRFQSASDVVTELARLSSAPQQSTLPGTYGFASGQPVYPQQAPPQSGGYPSVVPQSGSGIPPGYGGPVSQPPNVYNPGAMSQTGAPYAPPTAPGFGPPSGPPPNMGGSQPGMYPPPGGPQPRKRGISPLAIGGIVAGVIVLALGGLILIGALAGGGGTATATPGATATTVAAANPTSTTGGSTATSGVATGAAPSAPPAATPSASATRSSTPAGLSTSSASTPRASASASSGPATAFPTASGKVKLAAGKALPATVLPQIYVDTTTRYTLRFPAEWTQEPGDESTDVQFAINGTQVAGVTTEDLNGETKPTAQQIADQLSDTFSKQLTNFKMTDASQVKVANQDAVRMLYTFTNSGNTATAGGYLIAYSTDTTLVLFSAYDTVDKFTAQLPTFDAVAASFTGGFSLGNTYAHAQTNFTFNFPDNWSEQKPTTSGVVALVAPSSGVPSFNVVTESAIGASLQRYYDANVSTVSKFKNYKKIAESDTTIGGEPAKLQIYSADVGSGTIFELYQWYIVKDGTGYVLTYAVPADRSAQFAGTGPAIASTFAFT